MARVKSKEQLIEEYGAVDGYFIAESIGMLQLLNDKRIIHKVREVLQILKKL